MYLCYMVHKIFFRIEHKKMHEKHHGHDAMHAEMVLILIVTLFVAQILLVQWRQRHFKSYQVSTSFILLYYYIFLNHIMSVLCSHYFIITTF